jgi:hypothetical protein
MKIKLSGIIRWIVGLFFLLLTVSSIQRGEILPFIFCLLIGIVCIPVTASPIEKKINITISGPVRFFLVFVLFLGLLVTIPHTTPVKDTIIASSSGQTENNVQITEPQQKEYQDSEWASNAGINTNIVSGDMKNLTNAAGSMNMYSLSESSKSLKSHSSTAITESDSFTVSTELQPAKNEYRLGLIDANNGALFADTGVNYFNQGDMKSANEAFKTATDDITSCGQHIHNTTILLNVYSKSKNTSISTSQQTTQETKTDTLTLDDGAWLNYIKDYSPKLSNDMDNIVTSINNKDLSSTAFNCRKMENDCDSAIRDDSDYNNLSPEYQRVNKEWLLGLQDYKSGASDIETVALEGQQGILNANTMSEGATLCREGTEHIKNVSDLIS